MEYFLSNNEQKVKVMDSVIVISLLYVKVYGIYWTYEI